MRVTLAALELDAAGITDPALRSSYRLCRRINARHGRTYYLSTFLLPASRRPYVHALYGLARYADEPAATRRTAIRTPVTRRTLLRAGLLRKLTSFFPSLPLRAG